MAAIFTMVWASLLLGIYVLWWAIVPLTLPLAGLSGRIATNVSKVLAGLGMSFLWLFFWKKLAQWYLWRSLRNR